MNDHDSPTAHETADDADTKRHSPANLNWLSPVALACALVAAASFFALGTVANAVIAVGAGHVALHKSAVTGQRGRALATISLTVGYGLGIYGLLYTVHDS